MDGTAGLRTTEIFEERYSAFCDNLSEETVRDGLVPATTYIAISTNDGRLIGMIDIRHLLNDYLLNFGGHIGYSIRKSERKQGYATEMLALALMECVVGYVLYELSWVKFNFNFNKRRVAKIIERYHTFNEYFLLRRGQ